MLLAQGGVVEHNYFVLNAIRRYTSLLLLSLTHAGGKKCPKCQQRIFHDKWNVPPRLAEERWAHKEAREREVAEVADFLGL